MSTVAPTSTDEPRALGELLSGLPPEPSEADLFPSLQNAVRWGARPVVAIDDDPTGVQTVHDTAVLLSWGEADLARQMDESDDLFFVLTNSRSMPEADASRINEDLGWRLRSVASDPFVVASRSDSTLRGHFPAEPLALQRGLDTSIDGYLLVPAFFEGGRYTVDDTHWVATPEATSGDVIPASATSFARDAVFGYRSAHLPSWVEEKSRGRWRAADVRSISLSTVRHGPRQVCTALQDIGGGVPVVVNVAGYVDLTAFVLGLLDAEARGKRFLYRTAASFVRVRAGQAPRPLLTAAEIFSANRANMDSTYGGLVVVGSYQPATTRQLHELLAACDLRPRSFEIDVRFVMDGGWTPERLSAGLDATITNGDLAVLYTSRELVTGLDNLAIGQTVTDALLVCLQQMTTTPRFVIAKGGITSHEVACRGLGALRATVLGQLQPGVPVWRLESGRSLRYPGVPYVVFPGNVGGPMSLVEAARALSSCVS